MSDARTIATRTFGFSLLLAVLMAFTVAPAQAQMEDQQNLSAKNSLYLEIAGNGILYTVNYDRRFTNKISGRLGVMRAGAFGVSFTAVPLTGSYLVGSGNHRFELGLGPQFLRVSVDASDAVSGVTGGTGNISTSNSSSGGLGFDEDATTVAATGIIGYRYQPMNGGFVFRIGLTPTFAPGAGFLPWGGLSLGYSF